MRGLKDKTGVAWAALERGSARKGVTCDRVQSKKQQTFARIYRNEAVIREEIGKKRTRTRSDEVLDDTGKPKKWRN